MEVSKLVRREDLEAEERSHLDIFRQGLAESLDLLWAELGEVHCVRRSCAVEMYKFVQMSTKYMSS